MFQVNFDETGLWVVQVIDPCSLEWLIQVLILFPHVFSPCLHDFSIGAIILPIHLPQ